LLKDASNALSTKILTTPQHYYAVRKFDQTTPRQESPSIRVGSPRRQETARVSTYMTQSLLR